MKIADPQPSVRPSRATGTPPATMTFAALMGQPPSGDSADHASGFDALGMFGRAKVITAPVARSGGGVRQAALGATAPTQEMKAQTVPQPQSEGAAARNPSALSATPQPSPAAQAPSTAAAPAVFIDPAPPVVIVDVATPGLGAALERDLDTRASNSPPTARRNAAHIGPGVDLRLTETPDGVVVTLAGDLPQGIVDRFREAARRLLARQGQYLYKYVVNGEDRSPGSVQKGPGSWR